MLSDYFKLAVKNLRRRGLRSWLTMLGIFISIATIFTLVSLSLGLQGAVEEQFRILGTDKFFIQPSTGFLGPPGSVGGTILTENDVETIGKVRGVKDYSYFVAGNAKIEFNEKTRYMLVWGLPLDHSDVYTEIESFKIDEGRFLEDGDKNVIQFGNLHKTGNIFGKPVRSGNQITINDKDFKVKGIMQLIGNPDDDRSIYMNIEDFRILFNEPEKVDAIIAQVKLASDIPLLQEKVEKELERKRNDTNFQVLTATQILEQINQVLGVMQIVLVGIAAISLVVGAIGIMNSMYTSVLERTKDIGIMKAIGARNSDILQIFLIESGLIGLVGGVFGTILGTGMALIIGQFSKNAGFLLIVKIEPLILIFGLLFAFIIGMISGILPAYQASKLKPVDALRYE